MPSVLRWSLEGIHVTQIIRLATENAINMLLTHEKNTASARKHMPN